MTSINTYSSNESDEFFEKNLSGTNLSGQDLKNRDFKEFTFNGANLSSAMLNGANFQKSQMRGINLNKASLCGSDLSEADLSGADLQRADLSGAILYRTNLSNANLTEVDLDGANVQDAKFFNCEGLDQKAVDNLKHRGAIVDNTTAYSTKGDKDMKWWLRYVFVPLLIALISSGSLVSIVKAFQSNSSGSPTSVKNNKI